MALLCSSQMEASFNDPSKLTFETSCVDPGSPPTLGMKQLQQLSKPQIRGILKDLLRREDELRLSAPAQACFAQIGEAHELFNDYVTMLQAHTCREFSVDPEVGVELIRSAVSLFPDDDELHQIPHYVRHNRCKRGHLNSGDPIADCKVLSQDGSQALRLTELLRPDCPVVLLGASHT
eukprot:TRINITY_DN7857_c0_g1_i1.p1 TRINITY_DN7857_c0_g1~~TRINITY_DN7857_c0_g1_i1.p1  ORF type:complete len:178 (-),score=53.84 TRINITY_DN7857_c0_g1_i1:658-1191(-)